MTIFATNASTFVLFSFIAVSFFRVIDGKSMLGKPAQNPNNVCLSRHCVFASKGRKIIYPANELMILRPNNKATSKMESNCESVKSNITNKRITAAASKILRNMNLRADPCDDFYEFACGTFANTAPIPEDLPMVDARIKNRLLVELRLRRMIELIDESTASNHHKYIKILYNNCMNSEWTENESRIKSWRRLVKAAGGWPLISQDTWNVEKFKQQNLLPYIFNIGYQIDLTNASKLILGLSVQDPPIHPNYLREGFREEILTTYWKYMTDVAVSLGADRKKASVNQLGVLIFDMNLFVDVFRTQAIEDRYRQTTRTTLDELDKKYPKLGFREFIKRDDNPVIQMSFDIKTLDRLNERFSNSNSKDLANWVIWRITTKFVKILNKVATQKTEEFQRILQGRTKNQARWKTCVAEVRSVFDLSLAASYQKQYLHQKTVNGLIKIFENVKQEFIGFVEKAKWLGNITKEHAVRKIEKLGSNLVTCREFISDEELESYYNGFELASGPLKSNKKNITRFLAQVRTRKFHNPNNVTDKDNCGKFLLSDDMYEPSQNYLHFVIEVYIGALYNIDRPEYLNYGTIGSLMGQRISSAIDELGRNFNIQGAFEVWWDSESIEKYHQKTQCFVNQYENYYINDSGLRLNSLRTQKENVADNVGVKAAYHAFVKWANESLPEKQLPALDYSPRQMFWISMASAYCSKYRPEYLESRVIEDTRSPNKWRVNGPVSNMMEFAADFKCLPGSRMNPVNKCSLW